eukprot:Sdes_comp19808_c0_seq1m11936
MMFSVCGKRISSSLNVLWRFPGSKYNFSSLQKGCNRQEPLFSLKSRGAQYGNKRNYSSNLGKENKSQSNSGPISWASVAFLLVAGGGAYFYVKNEKLKMKLEEVKKYESGKGKPRIGGQFHLTDCATERIVTNQDFLGEWLLIYFGFTYCPDICPDELDKMTSVINTLEKNPAIGKIVRPVFISIDPKRDSVPQVKEYLKDFHPRLVGLTGTQEQVEEVARNYRVYYTISPTGDDPNDYLVDHSIIMYFVDPAGNFVQYYGNNRTADEVATDIERHIVYYNENVKK